MILGLLLNGEQQFFDDNGVPLALGTVTLYIPTTTTPKDSWKDPAGDAMNTNPIHLDAAGRAVIWGEGFYRQIVKDVLGNTIWDKVAPVAGGGSLAGNVIITDVDYTLGESDCTVLADASGEALVITLPDPSDVEGQIFIIKKTDSSANSVLVVGTIDGLSNVVLWTENQAVTVQAHSTAFYII